LLAQVRVGDTFGVWGNQSCLGGLCIETVLRKMENVDIKESETGPDNNRGDNESGQLGVDSGQVRKVGSTSGKENCI
jgi:hypothetical protein